MRETLTIGKGRYDETIMRILREKPRSRKELLAACNEKKIPYPTVYRRVLQLCKYGMIERVDVYRVIERIQEADLDQVKECVQSLRTERNETVLGIRIEKLTQISAAKRMAHLPGIVYGLGECLDNPAVIRNPTTLSKFVSILPRILRHERNNRQSSFEKVIESLLSQTFGRILKLVEGKNEIPDPSILEFLQESGKEEAVHGLFKIIKSNPFDATRRVDDLVSTLGKHGLYAKHEKLIDSYLAKFARGKDKDLIKATKEINTRIHWSS
jgi:hypothetical protein